MAQATTETGEWFRPHQTARLLMIDDTALNDSDKTLTVPTGVFWQVLHCECTLITTADAGNRQMQIIIGDGTSTIGQANALNTQAASGTEFYHFIPGATVAVETAATMHFVPYPGPTILGPGYTVRFWDSAGIAATADDMTPRMLVLQFEG